MLVLVSMLRIARVTCCTELHTALPLHGIAIVIVADLLSIDHDTLFLKLFDFGFFPRFGYLLRCQGFFWDCSLRSAISMQYDDICSATDALPIQSYCNAEQTNWWRSHTLFTQCLMALKGSVSPALPVCYCSFGHWLLRCPLLLIAACDGSERCLRPAMGEAYMRHSRRT